MVARYPAVTKLCSFIFFAKLEKKKIKLELVVSHISPARGDGAREFFPKISLALRLLLF